MDIGRITLNLKLNINLKKKIKIAIVGIGLMGSQHLRALSASKKAKPKVTGEDGLLSLKIFDAIIKSSKLGKKSV